MERITHNGTVRSDEVVSAGYVWIQCDAWGIPDGTAGKTGWHSCYCQYQLSALPAAAQTAVGEHWDQVAEMEQAESEAREARGIANLGKPNPLAAHERLMHEMEQADSIY